MKRVLILSLVIVMGWTMFAFAQDWDVPPVIIETSGTDTIGVDTVKANYDLAKTAADSAEVDSCRSLKAVIALNANDVTLEGNGSLIYGPGEPPNSYYDVQGVWPNKNYGAYGDSTTMLSNIAIQNVQIDKCKTGIYLTKVANGLVDGCTLTDVQKGIYPNSKGVTDASSCVVQNNTIIDIDKLAIDHRGPGHQTLNNVIIQNRKANDSKSAGIVVSKTRTESTTGVLVNGNTITANGNLNHGIRVDKSSTNNYNDNTVTDAAMYGIYFAGAVKGPDPSDANIFTNTTLTWNGDNSAVGVYLDVASSNEFDNLVIDPPAIAVKAVNGSKDNVIKNSKLSSDSLDVDLSGGSTLILANTECDLNKISIADSSRLLVRWSPQILLATSEGTTLRKEAIVIVKDGGTEINRDTTSIGTVAPELPALDISTAGTDSSDLTVEAQLIGGGETVNSTIDLLADQVVLTFTTIDNWGAPIFIEQPGTFTIPIDTVKASYDLAETAEDSAAVDNCRTVKGVVALQSSDLTLDGNGSLIYGPGVPPGSYYDVQGVWPNLNYGAYADPTTMLENITVSNVNIYQCKTAIYITKVANAVVENCTLTDVEKGIYPNSKGVVQAANCIVQNNTITNIDKLGIDHRGPGHQTLNNTITQNREPKEKNKSAGIIVSRTRAESTTGVLVKGNTITANGFLTYGMRLDRSSTNTYIDNTITDPWKYGIYFSGKVKGPDPSNANILTNMALTWAGDNNAVGICYEVASMNVFDNLTLDGANIGVKLTQKSEDNLIVDSEIKNCDSLDVLAQHGSSLLISNSTVDPLKIMVLDSSRVGIGWHLDVTVVGSPPVEGAKVTISSPLIPEMVIEEVTDEKGMAKFNVPESVVTAVGVIPTAQYIINVEKEGIVFEPLNVEVKQNTQVTITDVEEQNNSVLPDKFVLNQNYPNPFNPETEISYQLPKACDVSLKIYNLQGQLIVELVDKYQTSGYKTVVWDGKNRSGNYVSSGVYFYVLKAEDFKSIKRMTFLK
jgi:parallel beta-helix repeat protein